MIDCLYSPFSHWASNGSVWLYSDPHFSDEEMKYLRKNYISDEEQIERINSKVTKQDTLIILGDIGNINFISKINGYKVLITGNHDMGASNYIEKYKVITFETLEEAKKAKNKKLIIDYYIDKNFKVRGILSTNLFKEVYTGPLIISDKIILSHEPINLPFMYNIHGHDHSGQRKSENSLNVCAEFIDYTPVSLGKIIKNGALSKIKNIHRITIDKISEDKK